MGRIRLSILIVLAVVFSGVLPVQASSAARQQEVEIFLPFAALQPELPQQPVPTGQPVRFLGWENDSRLQGVVISAEFRTQLTLSSVGLVLPAGIFLVVLMDVTNTGSEVDSVGTLTSFQAQSSQGQLYDLADTPAHIAAKDEYDRLSIYDPIQPGATLPGVFVFDVQPGDTTFNLVSASPW